MYQTMKQLRSAMVLLMLKLNLMDMGFLMAKVQHYTPTVLLSQLI